MLSFLGRSALCIGAVAAAAGGLAPERLIAGIGRDARAAAGSAGRACLMSSGCLRVGARALAVLPAGAPRSAALQTPAAAGRRAVPHGDGRPVHGPAPDAD